MAIIEDLESPTKKETPNTNFFGVDYYESSVATSRYSSASSTRNSTPYHPRDRKSSRRKSIAELRDSISKLPEFPNYEQNPSKHSSEETSKTSSTKVSNQNSPTSSDETGAKTFENEGRKSSFDLNSGQYNPIVPGVPIAGIDEKRHYQKSRSSIRGNTGASTLFKSYNSGYGNSGPASTVFNVQPAISELMEFAPIYVIPGLEKLNLMKECTIKHVKPECADYLDIDCVKKAHIYEILDNYGHHPFMNYYMKEETTFFCRFFCENLRRLKISLCSNDGQEVLRFERPLKCRGGWFSQQMDVYHNERFLGCVSEKPICSQLFYGSHFTHLELWNKNRQKIVNISGPCYAVSCGEISFMIENEAEVSLGEIKKEWKGLRLFKIEFPENADVESKALLLAASLLLDYMHFENSCWQLMPKLFFFILVGFAIAGICLISAGNPESEDSIGHIVANTTTTTS